MGGAPASSITSLTCPHKMMLTRPLLDFCWSSGKAFTPCFQSILAEVFNEVMNAAMQKRNKTRTVATKAEHHSICLRKVNLDLTLQNDKKNHDVCVPSCQILHGETQALESRQSLRRPERRNQNEITALARSKNMMRP
jgi:hypothetical protein